MNRTEQMELINEIEQKYPVDEWVIGGIHVWPILRMSLYFQFLALMELETQGVSKEIPKITLKIKQLINLVKGNLAYITAYYKDHNHNQELDGGSIALFVSNSVCRTELIGSWYDRICDPIREEIEQNTNVKTILLECTGNYQYRIPRLSKSILIQPDIDYIRIKNRILNPRYCLNIDLDGFDDARTLVINSDPKVNMINVSQLIHSLSFIRLTADYFKHKLELIKPLVGFVECYYSNIGMAFNLACYEKGIPSIDIQHGVQGDMHPAYGSWSKVPPDGYELLPNKFWCWSKKEVETINAWRTGENNHIPFVGGNKWLEKWHSDSNGFITTYDTYIKELVSTVGGDVNILFTLQNGIQPEQWILEAIKTSPSSWRWFVRLHPGMYTDLDYIKELFSVCKPAKVEFDYSTNLPLPAWLRHVNIHITHSSTCILEAESFGVFSVATDYLAYELFPEQFSSGTAVLASTSNELINKIKIQAKKRKPI